MKCMCGFNFGQEFRFCPNCGKSTQPWRCCCDHLNSQEANFCVNCGTKRDQNQQGSPQEKRRDDQNRNKPCQISDFFCENFENFVKNFVFAFVFSPFGKEYECLSAYLEDGLEENSDPLDFYELLIIFSDLSDTKDHYSELMQVDFLDHIGMFSEYREKLLNIDPQLNIPEIPKETMKRAQFNANLKHKQTIGSIINLIAGYQNIHRGAQLKLDEAKNFSGCFSGTNKVIKLAKNFGLGVLTAANPFIGLPAIVANVGSDYKEYNKGQQSIDALNEATERLIEEVESLHGKILNTTEKIANQTYDDIRDDLEPILNKTINIMEKQGYEKSNAIDLLIKIRDQSIEDFMKSLEEE